MLKNLLIYNWDRNYFERLEMIVDGSYFILDDDKALSRELSNYSWDSSLSNEIILKLSQSALMSKQGHIYFHADPYLVQLYHMSMLVPRMFQVN